jgi:hypothetical protein
MSCHRQQGSDGYRGLSRGRTVDGLKEEKTAFLGVQKGKRLSSLDRSGEFSGNRACVLMLQRVSTATLLPRTCVWAM